MKKKKTFLNPCFISSTHQILNFQRTKKNLWKPLLLATELKAALTSQTSISRNIAKTLSPRQEASSGTVAICVS
jgi:hypothetical protein